MEEQGDRLGTKAWAVQQQPPCISWVRSSGPVSEAVGGREKHQSGHDVMRKTPCTQCGRWMGDQTLWKSSEAGNGLERHWGAELMDQSGRLRDPEAG